MITLDHFGNLYCPPDAEQANAAWGANCGPIALAAVTGRTVAQTRRLFPIWKGYTPLGAMKVALNLAGIRYREIGPAWPFFGLVQIQWLGSWCNPGIHPGAALSRTHWIAKRGDAVYDCNVGFWASRQDWTAQVAPGLLTHIKRATGWGIRMSLAIQGGMQ